MEEVTCKFSCPNCGSDLEIPVPGSQVCTGVGCHYKVKAFSKRGSRKAREFYISQPSKKLKYLRRAVDDRWCVAFCEEAKPFIANNILDLINPHALQTMQAGLGERLKRPISILVRVENGTDKEVCSQNEPLRLIELDNGSFFARIDPVNPRKNWCKHCIELRDAGGEEYCLKFDATIALDVINRNCQKGFWYPCWAGLVDYAFPIVINDFIAGVFFVGHFRWIDPEGENILLKKSKEVSKIVSISQEKLFSMSHAEDLSTGTKEQLDEYVVKYEDELNTINVVAENRYWAERRVREAEFLTEVFSSFAAADDEISFWLIMGMVLRRICEFSFFQNAFCFISKNNSDCDLALMASSNGELPKDSILTLKPDECSSLFRRQILFPLKENGRVRSSDLYKRLVKIIGQKDLNCLYIFPTKFRDSRKLLLVFSERTAISTGGESVSSISERRRAFLDSISREIAIELQTTYTISDLVRALHDKDELMDTAGHLLVGPLDSAFGKTERLLDLTKDKNREDIADSSEEIQKLCGSIDEDILHCVQRSRSLMFFTTIGTSAEKYRLDKFVSLSELLEEVASGFEFFARTRSIKIELRIPEGLPSTRCDKDMMSIVFVNLVDNAIKYSHFNKSVIVSAKFDQTTKTYTFSISDFGIGIREYEQKRVFDKYYRASAKDPRRFIPGTGIGLSVVKQIISKHNGRVWVTCTKTDYSSEHTKSIEGFNTTFWIELPRKG